MQKTRDTGDPGLEPKGRKDGGLVSGKSSDEKKVHKLIMNFRQ